MSTTLGRIRFLDGGYCIQLEYLTGIRSWRRRRIHAVFIAFEHPLHGTTLIDTGYGPALHREANLWPWRMANWLIPVPKRQAFMYPEHLQRLDLNPNQVQQVFLSHFHADHIGGARFYNQAQFIVREHSWRSLQQLSSWQQLHHGFLPALLPNDFASRRTSIQEESFEVNRDRLPGFSTLDYWGDGSIILIDLPGHALGHTGYLLNTESGPLLYVVDAFWDRRAFELAGQLPWVSRQVQHNYPDYQATQAALHALIETTALEPLACHCPATQQKLWHG